MKRTILNALIILTVCSMPQNIFGQIPQLGATSRFALFTSAGSLDNAGITYITGNVGTNAGAYKGFSLGVVDGQKHQADSTTAQVALALDAAYNYFNPLTCGHVLGTNLGDKQTLTPKVYCLPAASTVKDFLILDGRNDPNAVFVFKIDGDLKTNTTSSITLINGASEEHVFWVVKGNVVLGKKSFFKGTIIANGDITLLDGATLSGRGLTRKGDISLNNCNSAVILPLDLVYFNANMKNNQVTLNWATVTEHNVFRYELQRSFNGHDFVTLTYFKSAGIANVRKMYDFIDNTVSLQTETPRTKYIYYRLKQVDFENVFVYSTVVAVPNEVTSEVGARTRLRSNPIATKGKGK